MFCWVNSQILQQVQSQQHQTLPPKFSRFAGKLMMPESTMMHVMLNPDPWKEALPILLSLFTSSLFLGSEGALSSAISSCSFGIFSKLSIVKARLISRYWFVNLSSLKQEDKNSWILMLWKLTYQSIIWTYLKPEYTLKWYVNQDKEMLYDATLDDFPWSLLEVG